MKRRMYITMAIRMDSIRMGPQPASDWGHESPHPREIGCFSVMRR